MITYSIIQKSQIEGALRIDADYYQPEYLKLQQQIKNMSSMSIQEAHGLLDCSAFYPSITESYSTNREKVPFLRVNEIQNGFVKITDNTVFLPQNILDKYKANIAAAEPGDIIIAKGGNTLGKVGLLTNDYPLYSLSRDLIVLRTKNLKNINKYYLWLFLHSSNGQSLLLRIASQTGQPHLTLPSISMIRIPLLKEQGEFEDIFNQSILLLGNSVEMLIRAENLFLEKLELSDYQIENVLSFIVNLSEVNDVNRVDAEYFQPKYDKIIKKLEVNQLVPLVANFEIIKSKNFEYNEEGEIGVIKTKQLGKQTLNFEVEDRTKKETTQKEKLPILKNLDVIFASMGVGSLGKVSIYYEFESEEKYTVDSTLRIFRPKNNTILSEVLTIYLNSMVGQELIYKYIVGSSGIINIYDNYLESFPIPLLDKNIQQKIAELVRKSHEARKKSKELLEEAKRKVEEMVEKGVT